MNSLVPRPSLLVIVAMTQGVHVPIWSVIGPKPDLQPLAMTMYTQFYSSLPELGLGEDRLMEGRKGKKKEKGKRREKKAKKEKKKALVFIMLLWGIKPRHHINLSVDSVVISVICNFCNTRW